MADKDTHTQGDPDVSIPSSVILENYYEYDNDLFFSKDALEAIKKYNDGKIVESVNSSSTKLFIDKSDCGGTINWNYVRIRNNFVMPPLCLFHILQLATAHRRANNPSQSELFTIAQLQAICESNTPSANTIRTYLAILEDANLIAVEKIGRNKCVRVADEKLGPLFETFYQDDTETPSIEIFDPTRTPVQFPVGPTSSIVDSARRLFYDEVRAGMILVGLFVLYTTIYAVLIRHGFPFVEGAIIQYSLTLMALVGGFALGVGLLRRWAASRGLHRPGSC